MFGSVGLPEAPHLRSGWPTLRKRWLQRSIVFYWLGVPHMVQDARETARALRLNLSRLRRTVTAK